MLPICKKSLETAIASLEPDISTQINKTNVALRSMHMVFTKNLKSKYIATTQIENK